MGFFYTAIFHGVTNRYSIQGDMWYIEVFTDLEYIK